MTGWRKNWARLSHMSLDELQTRVTQEVQKRSDLLSYRLGVHAGVTRRLTTSAREPQFLFSPNELDGRIALLRSHLPGEVESILQEADEICDHRFRLLGYSDVAYGPKIDWHLDAVHGKKSPLMPWFKIPFLDFEAVGDHKVTWELNRHQHLVTLAKAWRLGGQRRYLDELVAQWYDWQQTNPYPLGINWASSLEVAFRSMSWLWIRSLLAGSAGTPPSFGDDITRALSPHARYIRRFLSTYFSPNTHLLGEAVALFYIGSLCPELPDSNLWRETGWRIVLEESHRQVRDDGVYFEQALYYHVYALDFFLYARILAANNGIAVPADFDATILKMLDVVRVLSQAGPPEAFGDDDGGRLFNPRRNRSEHLTDPLAIGAGLYGTAGLRSTTPLTEEAVWLFGEAAIDAVSGNEAKREIQSKAFAAGGLYVMADPQLNARLVIDAGPQGTGRCGHGHADALSMSLAISGRRYLIDSGTGRYIGSNNERAYFRGTGAHNTLRVDGVDQAVQDGPFAWNAIPSVKAEKWVVGENFDFFSGSHDGYGRLEDPVIHRRWVVHLHGGCWLIRDEALGQSIHQLQLLWHLNPELQVEEEGNAVLLSDRTHDEMDDFTGLMLLSCGDPRWARELASSPVSPAYGFTCPAPLIGFSISEKLPLEHVLLITPCHQGTGQANTLEANTSRRNGDVKSYRFESAGAVDLFFFSEAAKTWTIGDWSSDARFMYCRLEHGHLAKFLLVDASYAAWQEKPVVSLPHPVERFEWLSERGTERTSCSHPTAAQHIKEREIANLVTQR
ncbi:MAG TPA: alginate lyase family protein [Terriglobales bacterium]|nr:alginate lyase family protein [Terriglobales bacterium]